MELPDIPALVLTAVFLAWGLREVHKYFKNLPDGSLLSEKQLLPLRFRHPFSQKTAMM